MKSAITALILALSAFPSLVTVHAQNSDSTELIIRIHPDSLKISTDIERHDLTHNELNTVTINMLYNANVTNIERIYKLNRMPQINNRKINNNSLNYWKIIYNNKNPVELDKIIEELSLIPGVMRVFPNVRVFPAEFWPNDPNWGNNNNWGFWHNTSPDINAPLAWDTVKGAQSQLIAIIDTGVNGSGGASGLIHEEYAIPGTQTGKISYNYNSWDDTWGYAWDQYGNNGHGTRVAGVIAAQNNNSVGGNGVLGGDVQSSPPNYGSTLMNIRASQWTVDGAEVGFSDESLARGVLHAALGNADVINMSLGGPFPTELLEREMSIAWGQDIPIVAAMGNDNHDQPEYPAYYQDIVISVGAMGRNGNRWEDSGTLGSNFGSWIDVVAPTDIITPSRTGVDDYAQLRMTSCAVPFVTGLAGMIKLVDPSASASKIEAIIRTSGQNYPGWDEFIGHGLIQLDDGLEVLTHPNLDEERISTGAATEWTDVGDVWEWQGYLEEFELISEHFRFQATEVKLPFTTPTYYQNTKTAVWVEPEDSDGVIGSAHDLDLFMNYAAVDPSTLVEENVGSARRLRGEIITYVYHMWYKDYFDEWVDAGHYPIAPVHLDVTCTVRGHLFTSSGPSAPTGVSASFNESKMLYQITWNRNPSEQQVDKYWLMRAFDGGEYVTVSDNIPNSGSGSTVTTFDYDLETVPPGTEEIWYKVAAHNSSGWGGFCIPVCVFPGGGGPQSAEVTLIQIPNEVTLNQNYPNPFNPDTQIKFGLPTSSHVRLQIMNIRGQTIRTLIDDEKPAGWHTVMWDGKNEGGDQVASGVYLYLIEVEGKNILMRMTLIR